MSKRKAAPSRKTRRPATSTNDPATAYAEAVVSGDIVAGPHVRAACRRHLDDLEKGPDRGLTWDLAAANRAIGFFSDVLTVEIEFEDDEGETLSEAVPFHLEPSQCFIVGSLFGWKNRLGYRRFRRAFVEQGKGNGKSPLAAGLGHYMLSATKKLRAEVYSAATDKDQAAILFRDAVAMWSRSPHLERRLVPSGQNPVWQLTDMRRQSFFKPISSEKKGKSGIRPYCALIDEVHEHPDNSVIEMLRAGTKGNKQALIFEITNSGFDRQSVCWDEHEYSIKVAHGEIENDAWFSYVCGLDEDDEPFEDETCWIKANPLMGVSIQPEFVREQVQEARGMPSKENTVRRLHFCEWTDAESAWITRKAWEAVEKELSLEDFYGRECFGGLDLAYTTDLAALGLVFPSEDGTFDAFVEFWKPKDELKEREKEDGVPYQRWADAGFLNLTEGKVIKLPPIARRMGWVSDKFTLRGVAYDAYRHRELEDDMADLGIVVPMFEHPQGFRRLGVLKDERGRTIVDKDGKPVENPLWMPNSVQFFENVIIEARLRVHINRVLRWNVASIVVRQDPAGTDNKIFDKRRSRARIDGGVALAQALGLAKHFDHVHGAKREVVIERGSLFL